VPNPQSSMDVRVALLYQTSHLGGHLRDALKELGAAVVYEAMSADIDRDALEGSGARVVIVNLDADSDAHIDHVYDMLDEGDYEVVFNDAQVSSNLSGWDHARWARNLASKILSRPEIATPARPPGAEAVPTPVQKSASFVPVAEKPGELVGKTPLVAPPVVEVAAPAPAAPAKSSDAPTVELPLPVFVPPTEPEAESSGLDIAALAEFAELAEPMPVQEEPAPTKPIKSTAVSDLAAELDALFATSGDAPGGVTEFDISLPDELATPTSTVTKDSIANDLGFDIEEIELAATDEQIPAPDVIAEEVPDLHGDFPAIFDELDEIAAAVPEAVDGSFKPGQLPPESVDVAKTAAEPLLPKEWNLQLEPMDDELPPVPAPGERSEFGIEKMAAADYLAPKVEAPTSKQQPVMPAEAAGLTLELMPMEDAVAPQAIEKPAHYEAEVWLDGSRPAQKLKVGTGEGISRLFVLGASIGGPEAVRDFLGAIPAGFPMLFILAQHMGEEFLELMSAQLAKSVALTVRMPTHGERVGQSEILVVPTTHRLQVDKEGVITLAHLSEKMPYSPSIDQVLRDVADAFGDRAGAIIFSGMAHDAVEGSQYLKSKGGTIWVQDPDTCVISSMVDGAREAGVVSFVGSPEQLAKQMISEYGKG
jgi:chemosensory pili system protein ChpB (putative protein-glutamate methylesterase)